LLQRQSKGQALLDKVFEYLELIEKDYFGLQFVEHTPTERLVVRFYAVCCIIQNTSLVSILVQYRVSDGTVLFLLSTVKFAYGLWTSVRTDLSNDSITHPIYCRAYNLARSKCG